MSPTLAGPTSWNSDTNSDSAEQRSLAAKQRLELLLQSAREGDRQSIGDLLSQYRNYLLVLGISQFQQRLRPRVSPSDIVQDVMLRAHCHFGQFRGHTERELLAWLREILINSLARFVEQHVRAAKRDIRREISLETFTAAVGPLPELINPDQQQAPSASASLGEQTTLLSALLQQLPEHYREVLVLRNIQGLAFEEVATRLKRSPGATRMLWLRAIEKLRAVYRKAEQDDS
jgi:RNA polymerase sigma-70 factor (ECF subfamily)